MSSIPFSPTFTPTPVPPPLVATLRAGTVRLPRRGWSRSAVLLAIGGAVTVLNCIALVVLTLLGIG